MPDHDSILAKIDARGKKAPRVELRELPDDPGEKPKETARHQTGRYRVLGEIGRGGVGVVLMGRDVDLGRVVAMKVLRADHQENAELISRFVEEAQIGGQLQHPGIVPVYELGTLRGRPFFTMKLSRGRRWPSGSTMVRRRPIRARCSRSSKPCARPWPTRTPVASCTVTSSRPTS